MSDVLIGSLKIIEAELEPPSPAARAPNPLAGDFEAALPTLKILVFFVI
jgi:hypothetical protein